MTITGWVIGSGMYIRVRPAFGDNPPTGYLTDEPDFDYSIEESEHYDREAVVDFIEESAKWEMKVYGGAPVPEEEHLELSCAGVGAEPITDEARVKRLREELPMSFPLMVERVE